MPGPASPRARNDQIINRWLAENLGSVAVRKALETLELKHHPEYTTVCVAGNRTGRVVFEGTSEEAGAFVLEKEKEIRPELD